MSAEEDVWMKVAYEDEGEEEDPGNKGEYIAALIKDARCGSQGDPWCAIFTNAKLECAGIRGTRSALARSFTKDKSFVKLAGPAYGAICVFWRGSRSGPFGHVGFYIGETEHHVYTLGGNQNDGVRESPYPKNGRGIGVLGYYWPAGVPLPVIESVAYADPVVPSEETRAT